MESQVLVRMVPLANQINSMSHYHNLDRGQAFKTKAETVVMIHMRRMDRRNVA